MMTTTFDSVSDARPANHEFTYDNGGTNKRHAWLSDKFHGSSSKFNIFRRFFAWKAILIGSVFWLSLGIPMFMIWQEVKQFKAEVEGGRSIEEDVIVGGGGVLKMVVYEDVVGSTVEYGYEDEWSSTSMTASSASFSESTSYTPTELPTSSEHPWRGHFEELIDDKLSGFQSKWEQCRCPPSEAGPVGPPGLPGTPGAPGVSIIGDKGSSGDTGSPGLRGPTGPRGDRGEKGVRGEMGLKGEQGYSGQPGRKGDRGNVGIRGAPGPQGWPGLKGDRGPFFGR